MYLQKALEEIFQTSWISLFFDAEKNIERVHALWLDKRFSLCGRLWDEEFDAPAGDPEEIPYGDDMQFGITGHRSDTLCIYDRPMKGCPSRPGLPVRVWGSLTISEKDFKQLKGALEKARKTPGPEPALKNKIKEKMIADLTSGKRTVEELERDTLAALVSEYGGSANTADRAREEAISDFQSSTRGQH